MRYLSLPLAVAALAVAAIIALAAPWTSGTQAQTPSAPQISGTITIANPAQPENVYLNPGDAIYLKAYTTRDLRPIVITPQISEANHFHFRYHNNSAKSASYAAHKANLAAIGEDATGQYLLYKHIVQNGALSNSVKRLYFAASPAPAASADLCAPTDDGSCAGFSFNAPANNSALGGTVKVAGGGSPADYGISSYTTPTAKAIEVVPVNPPDTGWYNVGDDITVRLTYNARVHPISPELAARFNESRITLNIGPNNATNLKEAVLVQAGNTHDGGYADYRYTVAEGDADADGFQVFNVVTRPTTRETILCPEFIGPGCASTNDVSLSFTDSGTQALASYKVAGTVLGWAESGPTALSFIKAAANPAQQAGSVTGTIAGHPVHYSVDNLPAGLSMTISGSALSISGAPASLQDAQDYVITAYDLTGRQATRTISIAVTNPPAPAFAPVPQGQDILTYFRHELPDADFGKLPAVINGTHPIKYKLTQADGAALPSWITHRQTNVNDPGAAVAATSSPQARTRLKLVATDSNTNADGTANYRTAEIQFTMNIKTADRVGFVETIAGYDLDLPVNDLSGSVALPAAVGGSGNYNYSLLAYDGNAYSAHAIPNWITYARSGNSVPGTVSVKTGTGANSVNLRLVASDKFYAYTAYLDFTVSVTDHAPVSLDTAGRASTTLNSETLWLYRAGDVIQVNVQTNSTSSYTGQTTLTLDIGGQSRTANYDSGSSTPTTGKMVFKYTVTSDDRDNSESCAVTGISNAGDETVARTSLTGCRVDPGAPQFAANTASTNLVVSAALGGYADLPRASKGFGTLTYGISRTPGTTGDVKRVSYARYRNALEVHGVAIAPESPSNERTTDVPVSYTLTVTDQLHTSSSPRKAAYAFTIEAAEISRVKTVSIYNSTQGLGSDANGKLVGAPTGRDRAGNVFFKQGDIVLISAQFHDQQKVTTAAGDSANPAAYIEIIIGENIRRAVAIPHSHPAGRIDFAYTIKAGDSGSSGVYTLDGVIHNCERITGYSDKNGQPAANDHSMHESVEGCNIPVGQYYPETSQGFPVRTTRQAGDMDLDADDDGLIDISSYDQLIAMSLDANGDGAPDNPTYTGESGISNHTIYYNTSALSPVGFDDTSHSPDGNNGCPSNVCRGYELVNDITMPPASQLIPGQGLIPLIANGLNSWSNPWNTLLEGNGYRIHNLAIDTTDSEAGLFQYIGPNGIVRNLGLVNPSVTGDQFVGIIAGTNEGTISNVYVQNGQATATGSGAGLIAGQLNASGTISDFWATGAVNAPLGRGAGSVVGMNYGNVSNGWTDAFTDTALPIRRAQGYNVISGHGYDSGGSTIAVKEIHLGAASADDNFRTFLITPSDLEKATTATTGDISTWSNTVWDFGDACQKPVLKSGGHNSANQAAAQGPACTQ